ncbi:MAG: VOC family protein [Dehalococcoidia bacterium]|nr:VOC family protein [Dehalococcoidia bacterium]
MLSRVDRVQVVVEDRAAAVETFSALFGARQVGEDTSALLNAHRTTVQAGISLFELLEPAGPGPIESFARERRGGLYGAVFATPDLPAMARHLDSQQVSFASEGDALVLAADATHGMPTTIVRDEARESIGHIRCLYEVTNPVADWQDTAALYTRIFALDPTRYSPIESTLYGYTGTLTLFDPPAQLDRIEITQTSGGLAMDRFYQRRGPGLYMCYIETDDVPALAARLRARDARFTDNADRPPEDGLFIHPSALHGMLMGVSKTNFAWVWSGRPELAGEGAAARYRAH